MHISRIELDNIKSHTNSTFEFARGTTAITGENGAGKTTIIEAIAWVLFDLLEYKKEDFVKRGAKKGSVAVTFESGLDEREYVVYRDSGSGYHVTDPGIKTRLADKKEEVFCFLWQHLGLEPGTDLKSLFRHAIGVPQGTFTAIFLEGATERKIAFDRLLKVEEYRQAAEKLRDTSRYLDTSIGAIREDIARAEGELSRFAMVEDEYKIYEGQTQKLAREIEILETDIAAKRVVVRKLDEVEQIENAIATLKVEQKRIEESIDNLEKAHREIETLKPKTLEQETLERELAELRDQIADAKAFANQLKSLDERIERLRSSYRVNLDQLRDAESRSSTAGDGVVLGKQNSELIQRIAGLRASLERDEKFQSEIKNGLCPVFAQRCLNLGPGQTLDAFVSSQSLALKNEIGSLETDQMRIVSGIAVSREAERFAAALTGFRQREAELKTEGTHLTAERQELETKVGGLADLEEHRKLIELKLKALGDPRSRISYLERETSRDIELRESVTKIESNLERLENDRRILFEGLEISDVGDIYDRTRHAAEKTALHETEKRHAERRATFEGARRREEQLAAELSRFAEIRKSLQGEFQEKERLGKVAETMAFIRDTLKEAAPRIARNYVHHVSVEANQMFREITGNAERTLKWADDYSIVLEEDGYERPFVSLSGGEQMSAALAIRLALLKQLSDIRIAFFDEPTTNLDAERRENFAQQISRITNFDQLFVISHDDTFDHYVDHVVSV